MQVFAAPFVSSVMRLEPQWIDYNGHLNVAYYNVLFDRAGDELYELLGLRELVFDVEATTTGDTDTIDHRMRNFRAHETHRDDLWGHAELLPLVMRASAPLRMDGQTPLN